MRITLAVAVACLTLGGLAAAGDATAAIRKTTDIPAQGLGPALTKLAKEFDFQVLYRTEIVSNLKSQPAVGALTSDEALGKVLSGTGLTYKYLDDKTVTIIPSTDSNAQSTTQSRSTRSADSGSSSEEVGKKSSQDFRVAQVDQGKGPSPSSVGEQTSRSQANSKSPSTGLEEIVVTAQKRSERQQDVPIPLTAINAESLITTNQLRIQDYFSSVPGLNDTPANQSAQFLSIRGITTGGFTNPTVGIVVDDVPYGSSTGTGVEVPDLDPGDLARIEVLRGPQGTLYGASSMGGLIKFVTVDPSTDGLTGRVEAGGSNVYNGSEPGYSFRGSINVPVSDTLAIRASAFTHQDPGYIDNKLYGIDGVNEQHVSGARLSGMWRPSDAVSVKLSANYQRTVGDGANYSWVPTTGYPQTNGVGDLVQNDARGTGWYYRTAQAYSAIVTAHLGQATLTSVSGYNVNAFSDSLDYSFALNGLTQGFFPTATSTPVTSHAKTRKLSQELRLDTPIGSKIDWLIGAFLTHENTDFGQGILAANAASGSLIGDGLITDGPANFNEYAIFTDLTVHFTPVFDVQVGARESWIRQSAGPNTDTSTYAKPFFGADPFVSPESHDNESAFTYLLTPRFKVSSNLMAYARFASGYRAGGSNCAGPCIGLSTGEPNSYQPDKTYDYDLGVKADLLDHTLALDASLYYIDWKDIQIQLLYPPSGGTYLTNGSRAKSEGVELSVQSQPLQGLTIQGWISVSNSKLTESFPATSPAYGQAGDRLPYGSRLSGSLSVEQSFRIAAALSGFVGGAASYVGGREAVFLPVVTGGSQTPRSVFPAYAKVDLRSGLNLGPWSGNLYINNVADKRGVIGGGLGGYPPYANYYIQPRTVGISVVRTF